MSKGTTLNSRRSADGKQYQMRENFVLSTCLWCVQQLHANAFILCSFFREAPSKLTRAQCTGLIPEGGDSIEGTGVFIAAFIVGMLPLENVENANFRAIHI